MGLAAPGERTPNKNEAARREDAQERAAYEAEMRRDAFLELQDRAAASAAKARAEINRYRHR